MPRALLSVYDKTGLIDLGRGLAALDWELIASGGTAAALSEAGIAVISVEEVTHHPEVLGGRVKTLHPAIHSGILARDTEADMETLREHGYAPISLVVSNLYPFRETVARKGVLFDEVIEQMDIGGVTLMRAAAKNLSRVTVLCDPADYAHVLGLLQANGSVDLETRRKLAAKAFEKTAQYDAAITVFLAGEMVQTEAVSSLPATISISAHKIADLRYGENPHQLGALYADSTRANSGPLGGEILGGKTLSYNNILDLDAAYRAVGLFDPPTVVIVKHLTPCGIASGTTIADAYPLALASDPVSAFGGVIAVNRPVDDAFVHALGDLFLEALAAPEFTRSAQETLTQKRKNTRLLRIDPMTVTPLEYRSVRGGWLVQSMDTGDPATTQWRVVSKRAPTTEELDALHFAWKVCQCVKSNSIVLGIKDATVGVGGGLPSRVDAAKLAVEKAGTRAVGSVMASDAYFPFPDGLQVGIDAGVTAVVAPGGSIRDEQIIATADAADIAMVFTGVRHFRH